MADRVFSDDSRLPYSYCFHEGRGRERGWTEDFSVAGGHCQRRFEIGVSALAAEFTACFMCLVAGSIGSSDGSAVVKMGGACAVCAVKAVGEISPFVLE